MANDDTYLVCANCGHGATVEELMQSRPERWNKIDLWTLAEGREVQPLLKDMWVPTCPSCGHDRFYPVINSDEVVEYLEEMLTDGTLMDSEEERTVGERLKVWRSRHTEEVSALRAAYESMSKGKRKS
jgi:uncharacterized Zn finger protein